jgi:hypothetical protein
LTAEKSLKLEAHTFYMFSIYTYHFYSFHRATFYLGEQEAEKENQTVYDEGRAGVSSFHGEGVQVEESKGGRGHHAKLDKITFLMIVCMKVQK